MALQKWVLLSLLLGVTSMLQYEGDHTLLFRGREKATGCTRVKEGLRNEGEGVSYMGTMNLGGQPLATIWDTGSNELVVNSKRTMNPVKPCIGKWAPHCYDCMASTTYHSTKQLPKLISYGSGDTMVKQGNDIVSLIGYKCQAPNNFQELLTTNIPNIMQHQIDVVAGLSPTSTFLKTTGISLFSFCFPADTTKDGSLIWNTQKPAGATKIPVNGFGRGNYWSVSMTAVHLSSNPKAAACSGKACNAIVDTGTSLITLDKDTLNTFTTELNAVEKKLSKEGIKCTAATISKFPTMKFMLDGKPHQFKPTDYMAYVDQGSPIPGTMKAVMDALAEVNPMMSKLMVTTEGKQCVLMFTKPMEPGTAILGMPFFRNYKVTFSTDDNSVYTEYHSGDCLGGKGFRQHVNQSDGESWPSWESPAEDKLRRIDPSKIVFSQAYHELAKAADVHPGTELVSLLKPLEDALKFSLLEEEKTEVPKAKLSLQSAKQEEKKWEPSAAEADPELAALVANLYDN